MRSGEKGSFAIDNLLFKICLVTAAYYVAAKLGLELAIPPGYATAIWPASGIALASILEFGSKVWAGIWLGSFLANITATHSYHLDVLSLFVTAVFIGVGATLQALVGALLLKRFTGKKNFLQNTCSVFIFIIFAAAISCLINASIGPLSLLLFGVIPHTLFWYTCVTWWLGDVTGVITITSIITAWKNKINTKVSWLKIIEGGLLLFLMVFVSYIVFFKGFHPRFSTLSAGFLSFIVVYSISLGHRSFFGATVYESLLLAQVFISVIFITIILITAFLNERETAMKKIKKINERLNAREKQLQALLSLERATLESTADGIIVFNRHGDEIDFNSGDEVQGFYLSKPLFADEYKKLLLEDRVYF